MPRSRVHWICWNWDSTSQYHCVNSVVHVCVCGAPRGSCHGTSMAMSRPLWSIQKINKGGATLALENIKLWRWFTVSVCKYKYICVCVLIEGLGAITMNTCAAPSILLARMQSDPATASSWCHVLRSFRSPQRFSFCATARNQSRALAHMARSAQVHHPTTAFQQKKAADTKPERPNANKLLLLVSWLYQWLSRLTQCSQACHEAANPPWFGQQKDAKSWGSEAKPESNAAYDKNQ